MFTSKWQAWITHGILKTAAQIPGSMLNIRIREMQLNTSPAQVTNNLGFFLQANILIHNLGNKAKPRMALWEIYFQFHFILSGC